MINGMPYDQFLLRIPVILLALTIHEVAHGWAALRLGDPTARNEGRLTLNPLPHLDLLGTIMLMTGLFGWAKPVPVNPYNLRNPKRDLMLVSLAGPASNIIQAILFGLIIRICVTIDPALLRTVLSGHLLTLLMLAFLINSGLAFFNLLPIYPLDGSKILAWFLPDKYVGPYMRATGYALPVIFGLVIIGYLTGHRILSAILGPIFEPFMFLMQLITFGDGRAVF
ncbi:MAG: site-2 protease family protein [Chitinispirillales bacterium]|jgi:Zn-dependent protease|nr:site-2 protease family protein [Chitinispirillales bacterium]